MASHLLVTRIDLPDIRDSHWEWRQAEDVTPDADENTPDAEKLCRA